MKALRLLAFTMVVALFSAAAFADTPIGTQVIAVQPSSTGWLQVISPASNVRGMLLRTCTGWVSSTSASFGFTLVTADSSTPTSFTNGTTVLVMAAQANGGFTAGALTYPLTIPAGDGLFVYTNIAGGDAVFCSYDLL